jgi:hypothetical protein
VAAPSLMEGSEQVIPLIPIKIVGFKPARPTTIGNRLDRECLSI